MKTRQFLDTIRTLTTKLTDRLTLNPAVFMNETSPFDDYPLGGELKPYVALLSGE